MAFYRIGKHTPAIDESAFVAKTATVSGDVRLRRNSRVLAGAALRGDSEPLIIGEGSDVQEDTVLHAEAGFPLMIGRNVTVGHGAILVGCTIKQGTVIGMQAVIQHGAVVGRNCVVAPGAVIKEGRVFPDNSLIAGAPAKVLRELNKEAAINLRDDTANEVESCEDFAQALSCMDEALQF